jgi:hypothetical protein
VRLDPEDHGYAFAHSAGGSVAYCYSATEIPG